MANVGRWIISLPLLVVVASACAQTKSFVKPEEAERLQAEIKTSAQLSEALGAPTVTIPLGGGKTRWIYDGYRATLSPDTFIPYIGIATGRQNQTCSKLTVIVDDATGAISDFEYSTAKDWDHWTNVDDHCDK